MVASKPVLVLYNPVLHEGYMRLYQKYAAQVSGLYILGKEILAEYPHPAREVTAVDPEMMAKAIQSLGFFKDITVVTPQSIAELASQKVIPDDHALTKWVLEKYLPKTSVSFDTTFLRWDMPKALSKNPLEDTARISEEEFDQEMMQLAEKEAQKSPDWWRQVGLVAWKDGKIIAQVHNDHLPSSDVSYAEGDPRAWFDAGKNTDVSVAIHAEQRLIAEAAAKVVSLEGASIYVTTFPCPTCANLVAFAGIKKCYFNSGYSLVNGRRVLDAFNVELIKVTLPESEDK